MSHDQILGIVRHVLTTVGGMVVAKGIVDEGTMTAIVGGAVALVGVIWSVVAKRK